MNNLKNKSEEITVFVNEKELQVNPKEHSNVMFFLRNELQLTGTKEGCSTGNCGACTVLVDNIAMQSCQLKVGTTALQKITTIEHIINTTLGKQICATLAKHDAAQCGYCLPGIVVSAYAELLNTKNPNAINALERNLCRCGTHSRILKALREVITTSKAQS